MLHLLLHWLEGIPYLVHPFVIGLQKWPLIECSEGMRLLSAKILARLYRKVFDRVLAAAAVNVHLYYFKLKPTLIKEFIFYQLICEISLL